jgi:DNA mismatch repair protein MutL
MNAFERLVPVGEQVPYFIYFDVKPEDIDVNIHPTKTEIKFENEQAIWQILSASVKEAVGLFSEVPSIDFDTQGMPDIPVFNSGNHVQTPKVQYNPQYNPFKESQPVIPTQKADSWEELYKGLQTEHHQEQEIFDQPVETAISANPARENLIAEKSPAHYQYKGKYVMTAVKSGLMIIDQHRAHVRILYEEYLGQLSSHKMNSQKVLFPELVHLSVSELVMLQKILPEMTAIGFELTDMGSGNYAINAVPTGLDGLSPTSLVEDMVSTVVERDASAVDDIHQSIALSLARNAAIPQGQVMNNEEMENLVNSLFACSNFNYTPDGKKILGILRQQEMEQLLK